MKHPRQGYNYNAEVNDDAERDVDPGDGAAFGVAEGESGGLHDAADDVGDRIIQMGLIASLR